MRATLLIICLLAVGLAPLLIPAQARAEYRVYDLEISGPDGVRTVRGTLDDRQYSTYYPLQTGESVKIAAMWMCWERSDWSRPYCDQPVPAPKPPAPVPKA